MTIPDPARTVVFDLDDTLYAEADYVLSGKGALRELVRRLYGVWMDSTLFDEKDFIGAICGELSLPPESRASLLWHYRLHEPRISLRPGAAELIATLRAQGDRVAIITDGRSMTQRLKIGSLGLVVDEVVISEEIGVEKPDPAAFVRVEQKCPARCYVYVADNVAKDFVAPKQRHWLCIGFRADERRIHNFAPNDAVMPDRWANNFDEVAEILGVTLP